MDKIICPYCGGLINLESASDDLEGDGIIRDYDDALEAETFNRVQIADLTGDPFHDWPLIAARFQYTLPWLVEVMHSDPAISRYLKGSQPASQIVSQASPSQLWQDLNAIRPHLSRIVQNGQFIYGHQSRIAEALGVPNQGSYRRRIQNVARALERTLIRDSTQNSTSSTGSIAPSPAQSAQKIKAA
jgi:hypothetical protein